MYDILFTLSEDLETKKFSIEDLRNLDVILEQLREEYKCEVTGVEAKKVNVKNEISNNSFIYKLCFIFQSY